MADPTPADRSRIQPLPLVAVPDQERTQVHLPRPLTSFVGRAQEIATVAALLRRPGVRLITLTGPGGVGKTRLALRVATEVAADFPDGVWFVALAPVRDPSLVAATIAQALGAGESATRAIDAGLRDFLRDRRALLVLDNFEHVLDAGLLIADLLSTCPELTIVVTSRTVLRVSGEHRVDVSPLPLPTASSAAGADLQFASEAVQLFLDRAGAARSDFAATASDLRTIAAICAKLDGVPLAIELAAARMAELSPAALLSLMERRLPLLTGGPRDQPLRLRSMHDAIAWSYDVLCLEEQRLFRRLSVFVGGFTLAAAQAVAGGGEDVLDRVTALMATSLVRRDEWGTTTPDDVPRFTMLETIREYGLLQLAACGEEFQTRQQHAAYYDAAVDQLTPTPRMPASDARVRWISAERDNLRATLVWLGEGGEIERYLLMATRLWPLWSMLGNFGEGLRCLEQGLARGDAVSPFVRAITLTMAGSLVNYLGDAERGLLLLEEGLALARTVSNPTRENRADMALGLRQLGILLEGQGRYPEAEQFFAESLTAFRELGSTVNVAFSRCHLGVAAYGQGDLTRARAHCEAAVALARTSGSTMFTIYALEYLGLVACARGDHAAAATAFADAFAHGCATDNQTGALRRLVGVAVLAVGCGSPEAAARLLGAAASQAHALGTPFLLPERTAYERATTEARAALGEERFAAAWTAGEALTREAAITKARAFLTTLEPALVATGQAVDHGLTPRELDVLRLLVEGRTDREIAGTLFVSRNTAANHVKSILAKLGVPSRSAAAAVAVRRNIA